MPHINKEGYVLIARAIGHAKEHIYRAYGNKEYAKTTPAMASINVTVDAIITELETDNPQFDVVKFMRAIDMHSGDE